MKLRKLLAKTRNGPRCSHSFARPPTGGVVIQTSPRWIKAGAVFVRAGSALVSKAAMDNNDFASITTNAKAFVAAVREGRK